MGKRGFDIILSILGLIATAPLCAIIAVMLRLLEGPPVLFRQERLGRRGVHFTVYKFRTMRNANNTRSGSFDAGNSSRVTRLGDILRRTKMDELPQLWNVLRGDMSVVGPRPEVEEWVAAYPERWARVHAVRPGITDPASIVYRHEEEILNRADDAGEMYRQVILPKKLSLYEEYLQSRTFCGDICIILRTLAAVMTSYDSEVAFADRGGDQ